MDIHIHKNFVIPHWVVLLDLDLDLATAPELALEDQGGLGYYLRNDFQLVRHPEFPNKIHW